MLEEIPGIGEGRKKALLRHFGSLRRVSEASVEEVLEVEGFGPKQAGAVYDFFHRTATSPAADARADAELEGEAEVAVERAAEPGPTSAGGTAAPDVAAEAITEEDIDAALADEVASASET